MVMCLQVRLDSGDVLVYNGTKLLHALDKLIDKRSVLAVSRFIHSWSVCGCSAPAFWPALSKELDLVEFQRFCLQFRDSRHTNVQNEVPSSSAATAPTVAAAS